MLPVIGALVSLVLMTTKDRDIFLRAGALLVLGALLWLVTWYAHGRHQPAHGHGRAAGGQAARLTA